ncbi:hypothetical protein PVT71_02365 [Salipiger sp. H15]|uniref:Uncharacterized protein n=1 Tax=Alloyangia sp. H15 TaxID=3029062 RepID=A0AAU8AGR1_9RHOB
MRGGPDRWLSGRVWDDPAPRRAQFEEPDPAVTFIEGRGFRRESSIRDPDNTVTQTEQRVLAQRAEDAARERKAEADRRFRRALELGEALRILRKG